MKKLLVIVVLIIMTFNLLSCGKRETGSKEAENKEAKYDIVMLMDTVGGSVNDGSFIEGTWAGINKYCKETGSRAMYFTPVEESKDAYLSNIEQAIGVGAKIVICSGFLFEEAIYDAQTLYPDVKFIIIDGRPHDAEYAYKTGNNTYSILFAEQEAGFLAGYAAVYEGFRNLAFFGGMAVTSVARFGYGYLQGADYAAKELGLSQGDVNVIYWYSGDFAPSPEKLTTVSGWYKTGTEVIFSCGGSICANAFSAAQTLNKKVIGVDINQADESETCITSAEKKLENATYDALINYKNGEFPGGVDAVLGSKDDCVGLPTDEKSWRFENFTIDEYNKIYEVLKTDKDNIASRLYTDSMIKDPTEIPLEIVNLDYKN